MIIFLTGGSRGIGKHIKETFEENGYKVIAPSRIELDLSDHLSVEKYIKQCKHTPDVIINNAGINSVEEIMDFNRDTFINMMDVNLVSHITLTRDFLKKSKSCNKMLNVINIGSIRIHEFKRGRLHYTMSKACLDIFTKYLIHELGDDRLICNTVSPGYVSTDMLTRNNDDTKLRSMMQSVPLERFCNPSEVVDLIYHLAIDNKYINGQNIIIDGGKQCK